MVFVSEDSPETHHNYLQAIDNGIEAAKLGDASIIEIVNGSGYRVSDTKEAHVLLVEFRQVYVDKYQRTHKAG